MKSIWKFTLEITDDQEIEMPVGAKILSIQQQGGSKPGEVQLWAMCDPEASKERRSFRIHGTGHPITEDPGEFVATVQIMGGLQVYHVFDRGGSVN